MNLEWQTLTALGIVLATLAVFVLRIATAKKKPGCGKDCGCGK